MRRLTPMHALLLAAAAPLFPTAPRPATRPKGAPMTRRISTLHDQAQARAVVLSDPRLRDAARQAGLLRRVRCEECDRQLDAPSGVRTHDELDPEQLSDTYAEPEAGLTADLIAMCRGELVEVDR